MSDEQDQRYITIARACLKAINTATDNPEEREDNIRRVYEAIDTAFREQMSAHETEIHNLVRVIQRIADDRTPPEQARKLARAALQSRGTDANDDPLH